MMIENIYYIKQFKTCNYATKTFLSYSNKKNKFIKDFADKYSM